MATLSLPISADITDLQAGRQLVAFNAGSDGAVYLLFAELPLNYRSGGKNTSNFAVTQPKRAQTYRAVSIRNGAVELDVTISRERFNIHHLQPLGELLLLVCARSHYGRAGNPERNGRLYTRGGELVGELLLGDGIQDVQTTAEGTIWASYFDEGVFGNFGWAEPLGAAGLVEWSRDGAKLYEFEPPDGLDSICDCYALNVTADDVWLCYYTDFPLVRLRNRRVSGDWRAPVEGSAAFAIGSGHCLFQGGYDERTEYVLAELQSSGKSPRVVKRFQVLDEAGEVLSPLRTAARGERLYVLSGTRLYQLDVSTSFAAE
ncbi:MAG: hypothetical protein QM756_36345 [Polyangiaceae bacterium]